MLDLFPLFQIFCPVLWCSVKLLCLTIKRLMRVFFLNLVFERASFETKLNNKGLLYIMIRKGSTYLVLIINNRNDTRLNNRGYSLFFWMDIFLKHLRLIPNILKWQDCKIFTKLVLSQTPSRSSHRRCSVKKAFLKICEISWWPATLFKKYFNTCVFQWNFANF